MKGTTPVRCLQHIVTDSGICKDNVVSRTERDRKLPRTLNSLFCDQHYFSKHRETNIVHGGGKDFELRL